MNQTPSYNLAEFIEDISNGNENISNEAIYSYIAGNKCPSISRRKKRIERLRTYKVKGTGASVNEKRGRLARLIGIAFEGLIVSLFRGNKAFDIETNIRTETAEIDVVVKVKPLGITIPFVRQIGTHAIGEAKSYLNAGPKIEWINELGGSLKTHAATTGILFFGCTPRKLRADIKTALYLQKTNQVRVIPFGIKQIEQVQNGSTFLKELEKQYFKVELNATDIEI
jgi:hypothetical protein